MRYSAGIDLGGTSIKAGLVSADGAILCERRRRSVAGEALAGLFGRVRQDLEEMARAQGLPYPPPGGIGIGAAAIVDHRSGWIKLAGALGIDGCNLRDAAEAVLGCRVVVDCDGAAGALADLYWGQARDAVNLLYVTWGTGIGAGLAFGRRLYHSVGGSMGEFGHTPVESAAPRPCYCGCSGCLEAEASGRAMELLAAEHFGREIPLPEIAAKAAQGDEFCRTLLARSARLLAGALAGAMALLNPDCIVVGGGASHCLPLVRAEFDRELASRTPAFALEGARIAMSDFPDSAGVLGAAALPRAAAEEFKHATAPNKHG